MEGKWSRCRRIARFHSSNARLDQQRALQLARTVDCRVSSAVQPMNCSGCHSNGGGGMGPSLMDNQWIYGGRLEQIHQTIADGRPNGMPSWGARLSDEVIWRLAAYVRSMSLPATLAAQGSGNPSQSPAPVPRAADEDPGWSAPAATTNDYTTTLKGSK